MFKFFAGATPTGVQMMPDITSYLDFALTMFLAFGIAFEVPVAVVLLALTGHGHVEKLQQSRGYVDHRHLRGRGRPDAAGSACRRC